MENKIFEWIFKGSDNGSPMIAIKDKYDVIEVKELLEKIGISITDKSKEEILKWDDINNNFSPRNTDGSWRIQSHFLGNGLSIDKLKQKIDFLVEKDIKSYVSKSSELKNESKEKINIIKKEFDDKFSKIKKELNDKFSKIEKNLDKKLK